MIGYDYTFKVCVFANKDVGIKILPGFLEGGFDVNYGSILGFDFFSKYIEIQGKKVRLSLWIWSDKEFAREQYHSFIEGSHWLILMYDITNSRSLNYLSEVLKNVKKFREKYDIPLLLVGNKLDLEEQREVTKDQLEKFKEENYISESIELSLKTRENVENMFREFTEMILNQD